MKRNVWVYMNKLTRAFNIIANQTSRKERGIGVSSGEAFECDVTMRVE
jgi:hypothetical protein